MATTEYEPDVTVMGREALRPGALRPLGVRVVVRGCLHLCLANVGEHPWHMSLAGYLRCWLELLSRLQPLGSGAARLRAGQGVQLQVVLRVPARLQMPAQLVPRGQKRARGRRRSAPGCTPTKSTLVRVLFFPEPAGCFYFIYLIPCPINVQ